MVVGASGGVGRWAATLAVNEGHSVTAVMRPSSEFDPDDGARVVRGDVTDSEFLENVVADHDAVISCIGLRRAGKSPFAKLLSPPDLTTRLASALTRAMEKRRVRRLVLISAGGVADSTEPVTSLGR